MFEVKKYKVGDIVLYDKVLWNIVDINTSLIETDLNDLIDLIELGLAKEENYYNEVLVTLRNKNYATYDYVVKLDKIHEENKDMNINTSTSVENVIGKLTTNINTFDDGDLFIGGKYVGKINSSNKSLTFTNTKNDPIIVDYKVINNTVVIFTFADGTTEKTVCNHEFDEFELKRAVELAICKKKFGGTKAYHKAVNNAIKQIEDIDAKKKAETAEQERIAKRKAKYAERQAKRKAKRRQEQIDIQSAAFLKAMLDYDEIMATDLYTEYAPDKNVENTETE